jgi:hypothetical protein
MDYFKSESRGGWLEVWDFESSINQSLRQGELGHFGAVLFDVLNQP